MEDLRENSNALISKIKNQNVALSPHKNYESLAELATKASPPVPRSNSVDWVEYGAGGLLRAGNLEETLLKVSCERELGGLFYCFLFYLS